MGLAVSTVDRVKMVEAACRGATTLPALEWCLKTAMKSALRFLCAVLLVVVVTADLATFIYGYHYGILENDDPWLGAQLLCGGGLLLSQFCSSPFLPTSSL
ncbi:uncharacterized protein LOC135103292 [Scylla paramamosain]|uniref:uncharacterized protein LOC135103292 n=1 Tax=Scylla paramamosain TaxID=85552 RepID=UPI003083D473